MVAGMRPPWKPILIAVAATICVAAAQLPPGDAARPAPEAPPILGFDRAGAAQERALEKPFRQWHAGVLHELDHGRPQSLLPPPHPVSLWILRFGR
jgi:hypothetical protein